MSLNDDQFHVVRRDQPVQRGGGYVGDSIDTEWGVIHTPDSGKPRLVGVADYEGGWWQSGNFDRAFDRAEVGETPPLFRRMDDRGVRNMAVHPDFQGKGLGKLLANHAAEEHWRRNPDQLGDVPPHSSLSSASDGMISHLIGEEPADVGQHWDDSPDYSDLGLDEEDFADEETGDIDWGALEDEADYLREEWADQQRNNFAMNQIRQNIDMLQSVGDHLAGGGSMEPGTPIKDTGSIYRRSKMQVARPTARTVEQNSDLVQRVYQFGLPAEEGTDEPEAPKPRPFRNGQMRLPGTYQRRLP